LHDRWSGWNKLRSQSAVGLTPAGVELKAERRKPSGEKHRDIEDIPSLTGVLAHFRLHEFNAIRRKPWRRTGCLAPIRAPCLHRFGHPDC
jgi:hypothetical protein